MKTSIGDLALLGGVPLFSETLHVGRPNVGDRSAFLRRIESMLDCNWLTNEGPLVRELEEKLASYLGVRHCVAMCNGTVALEIAIRALGLEGEVIVPSFTFIATAHALQWQGLRPVFCDVDPGTHCLDPARIERHITSKTSGILGVNVWGRSCKMEELQEIADRYGLQLMFDSAHAFGASYRGRMLGSFGRCEVLSFHATKFFNTLEGGAVVTNDDELARKLRLMKNFGFSGLDNVVYLGVNGKMNEASGAMGLTNLERLDDIVAINRRNHHAYRDAFATVPGLRLIQYDERERCNFQYVVTEVGPEFGLARDEVMRILHAENVRARRYFWPGCHRMAPYQQLYPESSEGLQVTEGIAGRVLLFPTGLAVDEAAIAKIGALLQLLARDAEAIRAEAARSGR
jgi:dTDP-4-amino-4,6-dideoxygalactose transaminase